MIYLNIPTPTNLGTLTENDLRMNSEYLDYTESFQSLVNTEVVDNALDTDLLNYVNTLEGISDPRESARNLNRFIDGTLEAVNENKSIEFLFSIESNENSFLSRENADEIVDYKNKIVDNKFEIIKSKISAFSNIKDNHVFLQETILNKIDKFSQITNYIVSGIQEKTEKVILNSFEKAFASFEKW